MKDLKEYTITAYRDESDKEGYQFLTFAKDWATAREQALEIIGKDAKRYKIQESSDQNERDK